MNRSPVGRGSNPSRGSAVVRALIACSVALSWLSAARANWTWQAFTFDNDIWMRTFDDGQPIFDYRLGAGGSVAEVRNIPNGFQRLLSPSFNGELTDRVIQYTTWSNTVLNVVPELPAFEHRYNLTQAGTADGLLSPTMDVEINQATQTIDVWSVPQDQWRAQQQSAMSSATSTLTRYQMLEEGVLQIRRILRVGDVTLNGAPTNFDDLYVEAWTPFDRSPDTFNALALGLDAAGTPNWWYRAGFNIPNYPQFDADVTKGYAVAYNEQAPNDSSALAIVYGQGDIVSDGSSDVHQLNSLDWNNGLAALPGLHLYDVDTGTIIDQSVFLVAREGLDAELSSLLTQLAAEAPAPVVYDPQTAFSGELADIVARLNQQVGERTDELGRLATFVGEVETNVPEPTGMALIAAALSFSLVTTAARRRRR